MSELVDRGSFVPRMIARTLFHSPQVGERIGQSPRFNSSVISMYLSGLRRREDYGADIYLDNVLNGPESSHGSF